MPYQIVVVGASNIDISATAHAPLVLADSNPGKVEQSFGGVGRNIAENMVRLGVQTRLITAYGNDVFAKLLRSQAAEVGIDVSQSLKCPFLSSSIYVCINQPDGDIYVAVSDMDICGELSVLFLQDKLPSINTADVLALEANLPEETLTYFAKFAQIPVFADSVSTKKVGRLKPVLPWLTGLKINYREAEWLTGLSVNEFADAVPVAKFFHNQGVQYVLITFGHEGAFLSDGTSMECMPSIVQTHVNTTGCGDASLAGLIYAFLHGYDCKSALKSSMAMAGICAASCKAVSPMVTPKALADYIAQFGGEI